MKLMIVVLVALSVAGTVEASKKPKRPSPGLSCPTVCFPPGTRCTPCKPAPSPSPLPRIPVPK